MSSALFLAEIGQIMVTDMQTKGKSESILFCHLLLVGTVSLYHIRFTPCQKRELKNRSNKPYYRKLKNVPSPLLVLNPFTLIQYLIIYKQQCVIYIPRFTEYTTVSATHSRAYVSVHILLQTSYHKHFQVSAWSHNFNFHDPFYIIKLTHLGPTFV